MVLNEKRVKYLSAERIWKLGDAIVSENDQYKHLGIICEKNLSLDEVIVYACKKLKGTYLNIANSGLHDNGLNPITSLHIYNSVVLPKALYGCELWCNLSPKHILPLERAHRFFSEIYAKSSTKYKV